MTSKEDIELEELEQLSIQCQKLLKFISSNDFQKYLIRFIEQHCYLFSDQLLDPATLDDTEAQLSLLKERKKLYSNYKKLVNRVLKKFLEKEYIQEDLLAEVLIGSYSKQLDDESRQYLLALEDFDMFFFYMQDQAHQLYEQESSGSQEITPQIQDPMKNLVYETQGGMPDEQEQFEQALQESLNLEKRREQHRMTVAQQEEQLLQSMIRISQREEEERRRRLQEEEDEMLKKALEESMLLEDDRVQRQKSQIVESQSKSLIMAEETKQITINIDEYDQVTKSKTLNDEKILNALKMHQYAKIQPTNQNINQQEEIKVQQPQPQQNSEKEKQLKESLEERQRRLRIQRDLLRNKLQENNQDNNQTSQPSHSLKQQNTEEEKKRMNRCLNVLKEAANQMFKGKDQEINDIDYYNKLEDEEDDNDDEDSSLIFLNKGKLKKKGAIKQQENKQVIQLDWKDDDEL